MSLNNLRLILRWGRCGSRLHGDNSPAFRCQMFDGHLFWHTWRSVLPWKRDEWQWAGDNTPVHAVFRNRQKRVM